MYSAADTSDTGSLKFTLWSAKVVDLERELRLLYRTILEFDGRTDLRDGPG